MKNHEIAQQLAIPRLKNHKFVSSWPEPGKKNHKIIVVGLSYSEKSLAKAKAKKPHELEEGTPKGWEPMFLIAIGLSEELSTEIGFVFLTTA